MGKIRTQVEEQTEEYEAENSPKAEWRFYTSYARQGEPAPRAHKAFKIHRRFQRRKTAVTDVIQATL